MPVPCKPKNITRRASVSRSHQVREDQDSGKFRARFWELAGTNMGKVLGVKGKNTSAEDGEEDEDFDCKQSGQYGDALKAQVTVKTSEFARTKTIKQQRASLPVFKVRGSEAGSPDCLLPFGAPSLKRA